MSAAKQLALTELSNAELDERAATAVTSYGVGTRSYNRSAEKREMDRQREIITERYTSGLRAEVEAPLMCSCPQRDYPHSLAVHALIRGEWFAHRQNLCWPWSLMRSQREEPSTERKAE